MKERSRKKKIQRVKASRGSKRFISTVAKDVGVTRCAKKRNTSRPIKKGVLSLERGKERQSWPGGKEIIDSINLERTSFR